VLLVFYLSAESKFLINWHSSLEGWNFAEFMQILALKNVENISLINAGWYFN
jgi:hypothetical protein